MPNHNYQNIDGFCWNEQSKLGAANFPLYEHQPADTDDLHTADNEGYNTHISANFAIAPIAKTHGL